MGRRPAGPRGAACIALGVGAAWLVERTHLPGRRAWAILFAAPLVVPAFVTSYAWVSMVPGCRACGPASVTPSPTPAVYLPVVGGAARLDPRSKRSPARSVEPGAVFRRVILPPLRLPLLGGSCSSGCTCSPSTARSRSSASRPSRRRSSQYRSTFNGPAAASLAGVLVVCCLALLLVENVARGGSRYARIGSGAPRPQRRASLGRLALPAVAGATLVVALAVGVPMMSIARWLGRGGTAVWADEHLDPSADPDHRSSPPAARSSRSSSPCRRPGSSCGSASRISRGSEATNYVTSALPEIVVALALATVAIRLAQPLYFSAWSCCWPTSCCSCPAR